MKVLPWVAPDPKRLKTNVLGGKLPNPTSLLSKKKKVNGPSLRIQWRIEGVSELQYLYLLPYNN